MRKFVAVVVAPLLILAGALSAEAVSDSGFRSCSPTHGYGVLQTDSKGSLYHQAPGGSYHWQATTSFWTTEVSYAGSPGGGYWYATASVGLSDVSTWCFRS